MIRKGKHPSAIIDSQGELHLPETTILEPFVALFIGMEGSLHLGEKNTLYPHLAFELTRVG